jgi:hypothetical protein
MECCHNDGNAGNDRLENLRWDTRKANRQDSVRHGTAQQWNRLASVRFTPDDIRCIRAEPQFHGVSNMLARSFGATSSQISDIRGGRQWKYDTGPFANVAVGN